MPCKSQNEFKTPGYSQNETSYLFCSILILFEKEQGVNN